MKKLYRSFLILSIVAMSLMLAFQNCSDVKLKDVSLASLNITTTIAETTSTTNTATTTTIFDPISPLISGPPQTIDPTQTQLQTVDIYQGSNVSGCYLNIQPLSSPPPKCNLPVDIVTSCNIPTIELANGVTHMGGAVNLDFSTATDSRFEHFRFLRRPIGSIISFRLHTPKKYNGKRPLLNIRIGTQNDSFTIGALGCDMERSAWDPLCSNHNNISISKEPCDFRALSTPPQTVCTEDYPFIAYPQMEFFLKTIDSSSTDPCVLKEDSIYYINVRFPYPDLNTSIIDNNDRMQFNFDLSFQ